MYCPSGSHAEVNSHSSRDQPLPAHPSFHLTQSKSRSFRGPQALHSWLPVPSPPPPFSFSLRSSLAGLPRFAGPLSRPLCMPFPLSGTPLPQMSARQDSAQRHPGREAALEGHLWSTLPTTLHRLSCFIFLTAPAASDTYLLCIY